MYGPESDCAPPSIAAKVYAFLRIAFALLILAVLAYQLHLSLTRHHTGVVTFFGYFTVLSNILLATAFLIGSVRMLMAKESTYGLERLRGAAVVYMMTTGAVFALLLASHGPAHVGITEVWVNRVLHRIAPVVAPLDWMLAPPRIRLRPTARLSWLLFPLGLPRLHPSPGAARPLVPVPLPRPLHRRLRQGRHLQRRDRAEHACTLLPRRLVRQRPGQESPRRVRRRSHPRSQAASSLVRRNRPGLTRNDLRAPANGRRTPVRAGAGLSFAHS